MLEKINTEFEVLELDLTSSFTVTKDSHNTIHIYDKSIAENMIDKNFNKKYQELVYLVMDVVDSDSTETDSELVLLKINDLKDKISEIYFFEKFKKIYAIIRLTYGKVKN